MNNANATNLSVEPPVNLSSSSDGSQTQLDEGQVTAWTIVKVFAYYAVILLSLIGNAVVIKAIKRIGKAMRRKVHFLFIVNLSVADLLFAVENIPMVFTHLLLNGAWKVEGRLGNFLCRFDLFLSLILILTSNLTILAIAVEKFCGIFFPLRMFVSKKRAYLIIASTWLVSGLYASPLLSSSFASLRKDRHGNFGCYLCIMCEKVVNWFIFQTVLLTTGFITTLVLYSLIGIKIWRTKKPGVQLQEFQLRVQAKKIKALKMLAMLVVVFYISFIPFWISQISLYFSFYDKLGSHYGKISAFLMYCNGAINPLIYSIYNVEIRGEFKVLFTWLKTPVRRIRSSILKSKTRGQFEDLELSKLYQQTPKNTVKNKSGSCWTSQRKVTTGEINLAFIYEDTRL